MCGRKRFRAMEIEAELPGAVCLQTAAKTEQGGIVGFEPAEAEAGEDGDGALVIDRRLGSDSLDAQLGERPGGECLHGLGSVGVRLEFREKCAAELDIGGNHGPTLEASHADENRLAAVVLDDVPVPPAFPIGRMVVDDEIGRPFGGYGSPEELGELVVLNPGDTSEVS